jgi:hypothetical protein
LIILKTQMPCVSNKAALEGLICGALSSSKPTVPVLNHCVAYSSGRRHLVIVKVLLFFLPAAIIAIVVGLE